MERVDLLKEFIEKRGTHGLELLVREFIRLAPDFDRDAELSREIGLAMADLTQALAQHDERQKVCVGIHLNKLAPHHCWGCSQHEMPV